MNKLVPFALLAASTTVAFAQPAAATAPVVVVSPAPVVVTQAAPAAATVALAPTASAPASTQTHDWNDVNHVNGQLVKVGEENDYLKKYKRWNVSTNPVGFIFGSYGVSVSYGLNNNIAIRGDLNYYDPPGQDGDYQTRGVEIGVGAPIYFRRTYQGLFLEPGIISRRFTDTECVSYDANYACSAHGETSNTTFGPQMLVGWHWTWSSGLNFAVAAGAGRNWAAKKTDFGTEEVFPNGYMRFGYAF